MCGDRRRKATERQRKRLRPDGNVLFCNATRSSAQAWKVWKTEARLVSAGEEEMERKLSKLSRGVSFLTHG